MANLKKTMFREYDVRGKVAPDELNENSVSIIAQAFGTMLINRNINDCVLGHDYRDCSEKFHQAFLEGILSTGINVIDLGMVLTPMMYAAQYYFKTKGGVIITASHNPNGWSGFKLGTDFSHTLIPEEVKELYQLTVSENFAQGKGRVKKENCSPIYKTDLLKRIKITRHLKVVVNTGNGTAGPTATEILKAAGCEIIPLHTDLDFTFPHYCPNPSVVEMMEDTGRTVIFNRADVGIALDGDGDRLGATDEKGKMVFPDQIMILLARQVLKKVPGAKIIFDVKCSQALEDDIKAHGGVPIMWITGHSYIKSKRQEEKAPLAGETSGHIFFGPPDYYGFDDGIFTALKLLEYLAGENKPFSEIMKSTPSFISTPTLHVDCPDEVKYQVVEKLVKEFKDKGYPVNDINGARVSFGDGWGLVRPSSNLPVLVLRFEAKSQKRVDEFMKIFRDIFAKYPEIGQEWYPG